MDITDDRFLEFDETFFGILTLVPTTLNVIVNPDMVTITIRDDDGRSTWHVLKATVDITSYIHNIMHFRCKDRIHSKHLHSE